MCWWTYVFLAIDTPVGVIIYFTLGHLYEMYLDINEIIQIGYLNIYYNVILVGLKMETL